MKDSQDPSHVLEILLPLRHPTPLKAGSGPGFGYIKFFCKYFYKREKRAAESSTVRPSYSTGAEVSRTFITFGAPGDGSIPPIRDSWHKGAKSINNVHTQRRLAHARYRAMIAGFRRQAGYQIESLT